MLLSIADVDAGKLENEMTESAVSKASSSLSKLLRGCEPATLEYLTRAFSSDKI
jgi:hypothetical protein